MSNNKGVVDVQRDGQWSIQGEKIRVVYADGTDSVLLEDISSVSFKLCHRPNVSGRTIILGLVGAVTFFPVMAEILHPVFLGLLLTPLISMYLDKPIEWDSVGIETRGGKIISYSIEKGKGASEIDRIEAAKRDWESRVK